MVAYRFYRVVTVKFPIFIVVETLPENVGSGQRHIYYPLTGSITESKIFQIPTCKLDHFHEKLQI